MTAGKTTPSETRRLPDFLLLGAAKAGTTALFDALGQHPRVWLPQTKEPQFLRFVEDPGRRTDGPNARRIDQKIRTLDRYADLFQPCPTGVVTGEASTYLDSTEAPAAARRLLPEARLIAVLRHPVDRAFSQYLHVRYEGWEPLDSFEAAFDQSERREGDRWAWWFYYQQRGFYGRQLQAWLQQFPREQLLVLFYEDWQRAPADVLARCWAHLGLEPVPNPRVERRNASSRKPRWAWLNHQMRRHEHPLRRLAQQVLPVTVRDAITRRLERVNLTTGDRLDPEVRRRLSAIYADDIRLVEQLTGRDLQRWRT